MSRRPLQFLSLFSGVGGFDLGLERGGLRCVAQVEIDPWRRLLLASRWPDVPKFGDVRTVNRETFAVLNIDIIAGGFPCQGISHCNIDGQGLADERSGLWSEFIRLIREIGPRYAVVENVAALLVPDDSGESPIATVLRDLAEGGFDAEWDCLPASAFGAYHERDRVFILAHNTRVDGRPRDLLEAGREWGSSLQSRRFSGLALASAGQRKNTRLRCEPELDRLVRRIPGAMDRLEGVGDAVYPAVGEWIGRRIVEATA